MQKVLIIGRIGRDPETRTANSGTSVCTFSVACSEKRGGEEKTEWFRVKAFGKTADFCARFLTKGRMVYVEGKLETQKWQDQNGQERQITELIADRVEGLDRPADAGQQAAPAGQPQRQQSRPKPSENMDEIPW